MLNKMLTKLQNEKLKTASDYSNRKVRVFAFVGKVSNPALLFILGIR